LPSTSENPKSFVSTSSDGDGRQLGGISRIHRVKRAPPNGVVARASYGGRPTRWAVRHRLASSCRPLASTRTPRCDQHLAGRLSTTWPAAPAGCIPFDRTTKSGTLGQLLTQLSRARMPFSGIVCSAPPDRRRVRSLNPSSVSRPRSPDLLAPCTPCRPSLAPNFPTGSGSSPTSRGDRHPGNR